MLIGFPPHASFSAWRYAQAFSNAALNFAISSFVPTVTRTLVGQTGQIRPIMTLLRAIACGEFSARTIHFHHEEVAPRSERT